VNGQRFGRFELRPTERQLLDDGKPVRIGARAFDLLLVLVAHRGALVTKAELLDRAWPGLIVEEANVQVQVSALRKVLGPDAIATIPGLGYRLSVSTEPQPMEGLGTATSAAAPLLTSSNLPRAFEVPIGRESALRTLCDLLEAHRLVTVSGEGGVGKTCVAMAAARSHATLSSRAVWWVDLAAVSSADQVASAVAMAACLSLGVGDTLARLVRALSPHNMLLVLDNCEHLAQAVGGVVQAILEGAPGVHILATSQQALKTKGEVAYRLTPLSVPKEGATLAQARECGSLQLLERRASAVDRRFAVTEEHLSEAVALCRYLEGVPLAIEMAAARLPVLGFAGIQPLLAAPLDRLRAELIATPERQRSLRRTLDWSHSLLSRDEQVLLRRLSTFTGSFRLEVAQAATAFADLDDARVVDALVGLVEKSLVKLVEIDPPRYRLLQTTRSYAAEKLVVAREVEEMRSRHGKALASLAEVAQRPDRDLTSTSWLATYLPDYDDLDAAYWNACSQGEADVAAAVVVPLRLMDQFRGLFSNSSRRLRPVQDLLQRADPLSQARLHGFVASCGWIDSPPGSRLESARRAVTLWRELDRVRELHGALAIAATESARNGDHAAAAELIRESREIERPEWPDRSVAVRLIHEGWVALFCGDNARYRDRMRAAMALCDRGGELVMANAVRLLLASATLSAGDFDESIVLARSAVEGLRDSYQTDHLGHALTVLCEGLLASGDVDAARDVAIQALSKSDPEAVHHVDLIRAIAILAASAGDAATAAQLLGYVDSAMRTDAPAADALLGMAQKAGRDLDALLGLDKALALRSSGARMTHTEASRKAMQSLTRRQE
jgi:predicted ATPase/DNA-binding winged helix-turn-helix (wHTH) protein